MGLSNKLKTLSSGAVYCDWCGAYIKNTRSNVFNANVLDVGALVHAAKKNFCSAKCKRAYQEAHAKDNSSGGGGAVAGGAGAVVAGLFQGAQESPEEKAARLEKEAEERAEKRAKEAEHKARLDSINNMVFDTENEENFMQQFIIACEDYKACRAGLFGDKDVKNAYKNRLQKEITLLSSIKPELVAKIKGIWDDAKKYMEDRDKKCHILTGAAFLALFIIGFITGVSAEGFGAGIGFGAFFSLGGLMPSYFIEGGKF